MAAHGSFEIEMLPLNGAAILTPRRIRDERGFFSETYSKHSLALAGIAAEFVQDNHSMSMHRGVVRGLHFQIPPRAQDKLVRVTRGAIFDVAVDIRYGSPTFGKHVFVVLSDENWKQLWIPRGFAHGFCTLQPETEVLYKVTDYYVPEYDCGLAWDDPTLSIDWPVTPHAAILSERDRQHGKLAELPTYFDVYNSKMTI